MRKDTFLERIMPVEYIVFTMLVMYTKKASNEKEEFSKHKTISSHHKFHSLVCHLLRKTLSGFFYHLSSLFSSGNS